MTQASSSATATGGDVLATHLVDTKEYPVVMVASIDGHIKGTKNTFTSIFKLADSTTTGQAVPLVFTANQVRMLGTIHHPATSTLRKTLKRIEVTIAATAATILVIQLVRITSAPVTTNGIAQAISHNPGPASDAVFFVNPTTLPNFTADFPLFMQEINLGANTALTTNFDVQPIVIFPPLGMPADDDLLEPVIRAGNLEGYGILLKSTAAVTIKAAARIIYTEE